MTHLLCKTPRMASLPISGNMPVKTWISDSPGTLTVPAVPATGLAAPASSVTHCLTSPLVGCAESPEVVDVPGAVSGCVSESSLSAALGVREVVTTSSSAERADTCRTLFLDSGRTRLERLTGPCSPSNGVTHVCEKLTTLHNVNIISAIHSRGEIMRHQPAG